MHKETSESFLLHFTQMLTGKTILTEVVSEAITLICKRFGFHSGLIYEADQCYDFKLKEHYTDEGYTPRENFEIYEMKADSRRQLAGETIAYGSTKTKNSPYTNELLELFCAFQVAVLPIVDENMRIYGLIVFLNVEEKEPLTTEEKNQLQILLPILNRYVEVRMYQNKLVFARGSLDSILDNTGIDIYVNDFNTHDILYVNKSMAAPYGGSGRFYDNKCWQVLFPGQQGPCDFCPQEKLIDSNGEPTKVYTWDYQRAFDGSWFRVFSAAFRWIDGRLAHVVSSADITDSKKNEELIKYMANYDSLTNLPNRRMLLEKCEDCIKNAKEGDRGYVMFFDIDNFKTINDTLGHDAGDEFLQKLGEFFSSIPLIKDAVYRNGGDEFVVILCENLLQNNVRDLGTFILSRFKKPWVLKKGEVFSNTSIGVACFPTDGKTADELLHKADQAMYKVKNAGGGGFMFARDV